MMKDIPGYEGRYAVTEDGCVFSFYKNKFMRLINHGGGYLYVTLKRNGKRKNYLVHRLVAQAFIPNPLSKKTINHIDGNKKHNHYSNLEWATQAENNKHAWENGLCTPISYNKLRASSINGKSRRSLTERDVYEIRTLHHLGFYNQKEIARVYNVDYRIINLIVKHKTYKDVV